MLLRIVFFFSSRFPCRSYTSFNITLDEQNFIFPIFFKLKRERIPLSGRKKKLLENNSTKFTFPRKKQKLI